MTIVNISGGPSEYPITAISHEAIQLLDTTSNCLVASSKVSLFQTIVRTLECFLVITNQKLDIEVIKSKTFEDFCLKYLGAVNSDKLFIFSKSRRYHISSAFWSIANNINSEYKPNKLSSIDISLARVSDDIQNCINKFELEELNDEMLWLYKGWYGTNRIGKVCWFPLYPIYKRLGRVFTEKLHIVCSDYVRTRNVSRITCLRTLGLFIENYQANIEVDDFTNPEFIGKFWRQFITYYLVKEYADGKGPKISSLCTFWRNDFLPFVINFLIPSGLFAEPYGELPNLPVRSRFSNRANIKTTNDGDFVNVKLLTNIPLHVTDEKAIELLFKQIQLDVDIAVRWAHSEANDIWERYQKSLELSGEGKVLKVGSNSSNNGNVWMRDRNNPDYLKNAAATYKHYGHFDNSYIAQRLLPSPLEQTAHELGLPSTGALLSHCIILVANHPIITPAFLENLELYDKNGKLTGFIDTDSTFKLIGYKRRRGSLLAQQIVSLNDTTTRIIRQMIALTSSVRDYLRNAGDDDWRYLLLTCKKGFSKPTRIRRIVTETSDSLRVRKNAISLGKTCSLNLTQRIDFAKRFSLTSLRASCGVLVYLKTRSLEEMSKALGHANLEKRLIDRYLPAPIQAFFQERWIRIFQAAIIIEAMKESEYLLEASGFKSINELDEFLKSHALKLPPEKWHLNDNFNNVIDEPVKDEIVFGVNSIILTIFLSLQHAVNNAKNTVHEKARYWADLSQYLISYLETQALNRPDLKAYLEHAKLNVNPECMESIIYA